MNNNNNKKWIGGAVAIILVIVAIAFLGKVKVNDPEPSPTPPPPNKIENVPVNQAPKGFPTQLPIESGAEITNNYNATSPDGRFQAARVFSSTKSVQANFDFYNNYLTKNNWKVLGVVNESARPDQRAIFAQHSTGLLNVTIYKSATGSTVDLSFLPVK